MQDLRTRKEAVAYLQRRGLPVTEGSLDQLASRGDGPEYAIVLGESGLPAVRLGRLARSLSRADGEAPTGSSGAGRGLSPCRGPPRQEKGSPRLQPERALTRYQS